MRPNFLVKLILIFSVLSNVIWASDTVIKNASQVAPFKMCFTNDGPDSWPKDTSGPYKTVFIKPNQSLPFCLTQNLSLTEYQDLTTFEKDIFVAVAMWQSYFKSSKTVNIRIVAKSDKNVFSARALDGSHKSLETVKHKEIKVIYPSALSTMLGDNHFHLGYDINVEIGLSGVMYLHKSQQCLDQAPSKERDCTPEIGHDVTSIMTHELGHGYGIASRRIHNDDSSNYGNFINSQLSAFDFQTNNDNKHDGLLNKYNPYFSSDNHPIVFTGKSTVAYLEKEGLPKYLNICNIAKGEPRHDRNFAHFCNADCDKTASAKNRADLMGGWCLWKPQSKTRLDITSLDLHVLSDIGYAPVMKTTTVDSNLRGNLFDHRADNPN